MSPIRLAFFIAVLCLRIFGGQTQQSYDQYAYGPLCDFKTNLLSYSISAFNHGWRCNYADLVNNVSLTFPCGYNIVGIKVARSWSGISCIGSTMTSIELPRKNLVGALPNSFSNLTGLIKVDLSQNSIYGTFTQLLTLTALQYLALSANVFSSTIPSQISTLTGLVSLLLANNSFTGSIPPHISTLTRLGVLALGNNNLRGSIPTILTTLTDLTELNLCSNSLTGTVPFELSQLTKLTKLNLHMNFLFGSMPSQLSALTRLTFLDISNNRLTNSIPAKLSMLTNLNYLHLQSITHRDMKPENILLTSKDPNNFDIKISDLGFA